MNPDRSYDESIDARLRDTLKVSKRVPAENPWFERRVMAALPDKKQRRQTTLKVAVNLGTIMLVAAGWVAGGLWFLASELSLTSLAVVCSIPITTMFSGAVVAAPALKRLFR